MDPFDRAMRTSVVRFFLDQGYAPGVEEMAQRLGVSRDDALASFRRLEGAHQLKLLPGTDRLLMVFPFSAIATPYRVLRRNGQHYFANCAWDAVAFHPMLREPVTVESVCRHCSETIRFRIADGAGVVEGHPLPLVYLGLPAARWWDDIINSCSNTMVFLAGERHLTEWLSTAPKPHGRAVTVDQAVAMSVPIYAGKLDPEYERPPTHEIQTAFEQIGLGEPFWRL